MSGFCRQVRVRNAGFTLVEMIVAVAVFAIVATVALPAIDNFMANGRMSNSVNQLVAELVYAKSEAVKRSATVTLCASGDQATCSGGWGDGSLAFLDVDADGVVEAADGDEILRRSQGSDPGLTLTATRRAVTFNPRGTTFQTMSVTFCSSNASVDGRAIILNQVGRHRLEVPLQSPRTCA